jgi:hypothetical protein
MAFVVFTEASGRKAMTFPADKAREIYKVWQGIEKGSPKQQKFIKDIKQIYFATNLDIPKHEQLTHWSEIDKDDSDLTLA